MTHAFLYLKVQEQLVRLAVGKGRQLSGYDISMITWRLRRSSSASRLPVLATSASQVCTTAYRNTRVNLAGYGIMGLGHISEPGLQPAEV